MEGAYNHLGLSDWPFSVVPRANLCTFIAGRPQLDSDVNELLRSLSRRDASSIHVLWSWFGAGKTHSLYFLANRARDWNGNRPLVQLHPVYTEFPRSAKSFVDLYRAFASSMNLQVFADAFLELGTSPQQQLIYDDLLSKNPDLANALRILATGTSREQTVARRWLRGDVLPQAEFRRVGISQRIRTTDLGTQTLAALINLLTPAEQLRGRQGHRLIWLIDEFQRVQHTGRNAILDVNAGLHSLFNACPAGLSLVLSFSGQPDSKSLPSWFSPEMKDRIGVTKVMVLPPLQRTEARRFIEDVLEQFRMDGHKDSILYPFTTESCDAILDYLEEKGNLRPRSVMEAFNAVLEKADPQIEMKQFNSISAAFAKGALAGHVFLSSEEGQ